MSLQSENSNLLTVGLAQIAPVFAGPRTNGSSKPHRTSNRLRSMERASTLPCRKPFLAEYAVQAVQPEAGHLNGLSTAAAQHQLAINLGPTERAADRGSHSLSCSLSFIEPAWANRSDTPNADAHP